MTDTPKENTTPPTTTPPTMPPSRRSGNLKDIATTACNRKQRYVTESFVRYLAELDDHQSSIYQKKRPRQETLNQQIDVLDAMFTYLTIHADWKEDSPQYYSAALRAQKQFCATIKAIQDLKFPKPTTSVTEKK